MTDFLSDNPFAPSQPYIKFEEPFTNSSDTEGKMKTQSNTVSTKISGGISKLRANTSGPQCYTSLKTTRIEQRTAKKNGFSKTIHSETQTHLDSNDLPNLNIQTENLPKT
jgi:hypothetical protein